MGWLVKLLSDPGTGTPVLILAIAIGVPVAVWGIVALVQTLVRHRERIAMIDQGLHPDSPRDEPVARAKASS